MRAILHELRTGEPVTELDYSSFSWSQTIQTPDEVSVNVPAYTDSGSGLMRLIVPKKMAISISDDDRRVMAAGMLIEPVAGEDADGLHRFELPARGPERVYEERAILPYPYGRLVDAQGFPLPQYDTTIAGVEYGTMMKRLYQQAMRHPGGAIPATFEPDRVGSRERTWTAVDGKFVQEAVEDIAELLGGVEWDWVPLLDESDRLSWHLVTGTDAQREITSDFWHTWTLGGEEPDLVGWEGKISGEFLASTTIFTGGKDEDKVLISQRHDTTLLDAGFPLVEVWDSSHSSVSIQGTLDGWAEGRLAEGQLPVHYWTFSVRSERAVGIRKGDWCTIDTENHWAVPDGTHTRRIVEVSGTDDPAMLRITVAGEAAWES